MDKEKMNDQKFNTPENDAEDNATITAEDLIKRLKSNLRQNPNLQDVDVFEDEKEVLPENVVATNDETEEIAEVDSRKYTFKVKKKKALEQPEQLKVVSDVISDNPDDRVGSLEAVAKPVENKQMSFANDAQKGSEVTNSVKNLIASLKTSNEDVVDKNAQVFEEDNKEEQIDTSDVVSESADVENVQEPKEPEKQYTVLIENASEKTNIFDPVVKQQKKSDDLEKLFEEQESPAVTEAEQLTFSMTEDDLQKSIEEAEAFIFEREHIDNPEEIINGGENVSAENLISDGESSIGEDYDPTDLWIASAFGDEDEVKNIYGEEAAQEVQTQLDIDVNEYLKSETKDIRTTILDEEFTSSSQAKEIFTKYRKEHKVSLIKIASCFVLLFFAFLYDNLPAFGAGLPGAIDPKNYPAIYILISLQILVIASALAWRPLYIGVRSFIKMKPMPESLTALVVAVSSVYYIIQCFVSETDSSVTLYVFPVILCIFFTLIYDFLNLKREIYSFNIVASKRIKYMINHVENENAILENQAFSDYLSDEEDVAMFKIGKTNFVKGFYDRMNSYSKSNSILNLIIPVSVAIALIFFIVATIIGDTKVGLSAAFLAFVLATPFSLMLTFSFPFYVASKKAFDDDSAIIGNGSLEEYAHANTLSFDDKDVFPAYGVKVKSIKVYGNSRIDKILYNAASIFKLIGGPLSEVFDTATHELGNSENIEIIDTSKDGIEAIVDGQHIYLGKTAFLRNNGYVPVVEDGDEELETRGEASIMYMVCDDEVSAKMYVQYTIDPDFEYTLRSLYKAGVCIGIKTFDPNIDDKLLSSKVNITKYPVRILRCSSADELSSTQEEAESGVVSKGSPRNLLNAFTLCGKVLNATRTAVTVKILSIVFSVLLMACLLVFGNGMTIPSLYVALYQLFWMIPVYMISKFYI